MRILLASTSSDRKTVLTEAGIPFETVGNDYDEGQCDERNPLQRPQLLAREKALSVAASGNHGNALIIGADTVIMGPDGDLFEKPRDADHARSMLERLSGRTCFVITGHCVVRTEDGHDDNEVSCISITYKELSTVEIDDYIESGAWRSMSGAMNIEEQIRRGWVDRMGEDVNGIKGLSIEALRLIFRRMGHECLLNAK